MQIALLVFFGGGLGAVARWGVGLWAARAFGAAYPWGTLGVNVAGGFAMGLVVALATRQGWSQDARLFLTAGVLGGFTTFSAFSLETARMIEDGRWGEAGLYVAVSVALSIGALFAGLALGRAGG